MKPRAEQRLAELRALFPLREGVQPRFDELVFAIYELRDPATIQPILALADDDCPLSGLMNSMLESLEGFPPEIYVPEFLQALPSFARTSPNQCLNELKKLFWSPDRLAVLTSSIASAGPKRRSALRALLNRIDTASLAEASATLLRLL
jgi:hypothetical protein